MADRLSSGAMNAVIEQMITANAAALEHWLAGEPGAWGFLAGKAVIAVREAAGKGLEEAERRRVWQLLWDRLTAIRERRG